MKYVWILQLNWSTIDYNRGETIIGIYSSRKALEIATKLFVCKTLPVQLPHITGCVDYMLHSVDIVHYQAEMNKESKPRQVWTSPFNEERREYLEKMAEEIENDAASGLIH